MYVGCDKKLVRKHFNTLAAARTWREDAGVAVRAGKLRAPTKTRLEDAARKLIAGMEDGSIYDRSGKRYKPATIRGYERNLRLHILPRLGARKLSQIERRDVQRLVERLHGEGLAASTINNTLDPLRVMYRRAIHAGDVMIDPTDGLNLPRRGRATGSLTGPRRRPSSARSPRASVRCGPRRSTPACDAASCARCAGATSTCGRAGGDPRPPHVGRQRGRARRHED